MTPRNLILTVFCALLASDGLAQSKLELDGISFQGVLHDNVSNQKRQGSGFTPLVPKLFPTANLFRDDAVGLNFEHIFNGAKAEHSISMFTPRRDPCQLKSLGNHRYQIKWPSQKSKWELEAQMVYDFSNKDCVDMTFRCVPAKDMYSQGFVALMWASYMNCALNRKIHFWGTQGDRKGWVSFGEGKGRNIETGTVACAGVPNLPFEKGAQTLNLVEDTDKKFITPFYYGLLDGDHDLKTTDDQLLFLVLFDQTRSIRFAMWNFYRNEAGEPDTHSPAWDWQFVIRRPQIGKSYGYRARVVVKPFKGKKQIWQEYRKWSEHLKVKLPPGPTDE